MSDTLTSAVEQKLARLCADVKAMGSVLVAFSGGVDSTLVARVACEQLGENALAVTARSETYPQSEFEAAVGLARQIGIRHATIETSELAVDGFRDNPPDRCYYCKRELFSRLRALADEAGLRHVAEGSNFDDTSDFRPGMRAVAELDVRSPLKDGGLTKDDVRQISRALGLPTWDKPSFACLASRFPYGEEITGPKLNRVAEAEAFLRSLGLRQLRVRQHADTARIEVPANDIPLLAAQGTRDQIVARLKALGFTYVTLDLEGYRTGSMNEVLDQELIRDATQRGDGKDAAPGN